MKKFIDSLQVKKMDAGEIAYMIDENQKDLINFYVKQGFRMKNAETINTLFDKMMKEKFVKALKKIIKSEDGNGLDPAFVVIINGLIEKNHKSEKMTDELLEAYTKIINKVLKPRIKEISKVVDIDKDIIKELLVIVPNAECVSSEKATGFYSQKMLRKLYLIASDKEIGLDNTKKIKKLFKALFGKNILDLIAINILLEKKEYMKNFNENQIAVWNIFTDFALEYIEKQDKKHITELIEYYCNRRKNDDERNRDAARRISLTNIDEEKYPTITNRVAKFAKTSKESIAKYL